MKKYYSIGSVLIITISLLFVLKYNYFWPFETASKVHAFLGTKFEMSSQEAQRTLKEYGAKLVTLDSFKKLEPRLSETTGFNEQLGFVPMESVQQKNLYMPSIEMFNSEVVADFTFTENKLTEIEICFYPFSINDQSNLIQHIAMLLKNNYPLIKKEQSNTMPGAYSFSYENNSVRIFFWVNLTDPSKPIIRLGQIYMPPVILHQNEIKKRQTNLI